eukprot:scaffold11.g4060.t1
MSAPEEQLEQCFARLDTQLKAKQRKRALKTADEILRLAPGDGDAVRVKVVLHIELGNYEEALKVVAEQGLEGELGFERAYCLYRQGKLEEAAAALPAAAADPSRQAAARLLEAQLAYRQGRYARAADLYGALLQQQGKARGRGTRGAAGEREGRGARGAEAAGEGQEVAANAVAAAVAAGRAAEVPGLMGAWKVGPQDSFELAFNAACGLVEHGELAQAEEALALAQRVGEEALYEEELEEEEVAQELAPVTAQQAYVADRLGRREAAAATLARLLALSLDDEATAAVASANLAAALLRGEAAAGGAGLRRVAGEAVKRLEAFLERSGGQLRIKPGLSSRLGPAQREALLASYATAALMGGKPDVAKQAAAALEAQQEQAAEQGAPRSAALPALRAALLAREGKAKEAAAVLEAATAAGGAAGGAQLVLLRAQVAAAGGDAAGAAALLAGTAAGGGGGPAPPAALATRLALLEHAGRAGEAAAELERALAQWQGAGEGAPGRAAALTWIVRQLAGAKLAAGDLEGASACYQRLLAGGAAAAPPRDAPTAELLLRHARLLAATGAGPSAELGAALLPGGSAPAGAALPRGEVDALEAAGGAAAAGRAAEGAAAVPVTAAAAAAAGKAEEAKAPPKHKRKRKRLPKGFDPANPGPAPDPERWLPKWQRSDAKRLRRKLRSKQEAKGSQGAGKVDESLDRTHAPMEEEQPPKPARPAGRPPGGKGKKGRR